MSSKPVQVSKPNIMFFDIESSSLNANYGITLCMGYAFNDEKTEMLSLADHKKQYKTDPTNDKLMLIDIANVFAQADIVCSWYGIGFDVKFLNSRMLYHHLPPLPNVAHLDLWWTCKKTFALNSNRLQSFQEFAELEDAKNRIMPMLWIKAMSGHGPSLKYVKDHCYHDIEVLRLAYKRMQPFISGHPTMRKVLNDKSHPVCDNCGSYKIQQRGKLITMARHYVRYQCQECGHWFKGDWVKE